MAKASNERVKQYGCPMDGCSYKPAARDTKAWESLADHIKARHRDFATVCGCKTADGKEACK